MRKKIAVVLPKKATRKRFKPFANATAVAVRIVLTLLLSALCGFDYSAFASSSKIIEVSKKGSDKNDGQPGHPVFTIQKAQEIAQPGDKVVIHQGTYREMIILDKGGEPGGRNITYEAAPGEKVLIKGSERIQTWVCTGVHIWRAEIDNSLFKQFNPFNRLISDSSAFHLGEVYLDGKPFKETRYLNRVKSTAGAWYVSPNKDKITITANFGTADPNIRVTEINVRQAAFSAENAGVNYIVLRGLKISQIASQVSSVTGTESGAIWINGGANWLIEDCEISDCKSVAIALGQNGHEYPESSPARPAFSDLSLDIAKVGHHIIQHNHIFRCGQAAVFGLLQGTDSQISNNLIEDINVNEEFPTSTEIAGIRLTLAVDALISHNLIRRVHGNGVHLGPLLQGGRITRNIITETDQSSIFLYDSHGPALIDNNIIEGGGIKLLSSEANVFVQNLFNNCAFSNGKVPGRSFATSNFNRHSLIIKQTIPALPMDDRWYNNIFSGAGLDKVSCLADCKADYNLFINGAAASTWGDEYSKSITGAISFKLINNTKGIDLVFDEHFLPKMKHPVLSPDYIGFFTLSKQYLEYPDGKAITVNRDFRNTFSNGQSTILSGPFYQNLSRQNKPEKLYNY